MELDCYSYWPASQVNNQVMMLTFFSGSTEKSELVLRATYQDKRLFTTKYLRSRSLNNAKSASHTIKSNCHIKRSQSSLTLNSQESNKHFSTTARTVFDNPRKRPLLERKVVFDDGNHLNSSSGTTLQVARFKSIIGNRLKKLEKETETNKSLKANESKSSSQTHIDQEAHSYAKLIANYSRAMEADSSFHSRSFDKSFGRPNMLFNSSFERVVSSFSKVTGRKDPKIGSNFVRSSSAPSSKHCREIQTDVDKNGRSSFYSTDSRKQDWMKKVDTAFDELKKSRIDKSKGLNNAVKLEEKDVLESVVQPADWIDKVVKAYKKLKAVGTIPLKTIPSEIEKPDQVKRTMDLGKEEPQNTNVSKKIPMGSEDSVIDSFLQNTPSPIELSFAPVIDTIEHPTEMVFSIEKENPIEAEKKSNSERGKLIKESFHFPSSSRNNQEDSNHFFPASIHKKNVNPGTGKISMNDSKNSESSLSDNIELRVHGRPSSELKSVVIKDDQINIVSSVDKIEIRIPISSLLDENKNTKDVDQILRSSSTLKLKISAKIEDKNVVSKEETKSEFKRVKVEPKKEVKIVLSSPDERRSIKGDDLEKTGTEMPSKNFPWRTQIEPENKSQKVLNVPPEAKEEDVLKKTNQAKTEKSLSLSSKKLKQAAVSAESNDRTLQTSVVTPKKVSENLETSAKLEKIVHDSPFKDQEEVKIQKNKEVEDNLVKKDTGTNLNLNISKLKSRKRRKGTTVISRVIENELMKKNEQINLKDKKVTGLTTETGKNLPLAEALKPETQKDQNTSTIDKVTKTDEVTDQHVKKLSESVTVAKDESKKVFDLSASELLKIKQKGLSTKESPKKAIATSVTEGKLPEIKSESEASEKKVLSEKPHTFLNSQIKPLTSLPKIVDTAKEDESQGKQGKKSGLEDYKAKTVSGSNNKVNLNKDGPTFVEKSGKSEPIEGKDIPDELKPIEKRKDGTLIDYGLKISSRKSQGKDFRKSSSKEPTIIKGMVKEVILKKEERLVSGNEKNENTRTFANAFQLNSAKEQKENNSLKGIPTKEAEITSPSPKEESLKLKSVQIVQREKSSEIPLAKAEKSLMAQSISNMKTTVFKSSLKLLEFEENHIFSGPDRKSTIKDS